MKIDWDAVKDMATSDKICGGPKHCKDREYDNAKEDCAECLKDLNSTD